MGRRWLSSRAELAFSEGRFSDAIKLYLDAWEAVPSAAILYNVAFIYDRRLEDFDLAIQYYDRAAASSDADASLVEKARARVAAIRAEKKNREKPPFKPDPEPEPDTPIKWGPILTMGGGGALFLGGLAMGFVASSTEDDFLAATSAADKRSFQSTGQTQALVADILMVSGLLTAAGGFVWWLFDEPSSEQSVGVTGLRVEPMLMPGGGGFVIGGGL
jgi:tetratricopeptide (TPR) repeat protein